MKIGDEVYVHGYVDEIRSDVVIIRNDGGYFGTVPSEVNCSEKPNTCETCLYRSIPWDAPICDSCTMANSHYERDEFAKDTNVRSKDCETCKHDLWHTPRMCGKCVRQEDGTPSMYKPKTKLQPRCPKCGVRGYIRSLESMGVKPKKSDEYKWKCTNCNKYFREEPKDEPQTMDTFAIDMAIAKCKARHNNCKNCDKTCMWRNEPQTEDAYAYDEDDWYDKAERESE